LAGALPQRRKIGEDPLDALRYERPALTVATHPQIFQNAQRGAKVLPFPARKGKGKRARGK
jgi:hypothetical protein